MESADARCILLTRVSVASSFVAFDLYWLLKLYSYKFKLNERIVYLPQRKHETQHVNAWVKYNGRLVMYQLFTKLHTLTPTHGSVTKRRSVAVTWAYTVSRCEL